ncbi:hypothetical protein PBI_LESEDI_83 [Mycobacterium phage Lesedi]|uniref:Uncharacterized protein n=1 Tax=Mycobacterium phage Lesedi TaxID=2922211 RepID=G1D3M9_9CAUD|nr:hypothetical protein FGG26_gp83 [Mycobacterium phage Lesedi]AEK09379.1 hypothetical protein PBI_LESEDI_83 [Mycobacterium phage Lesedi]
MTATAYAACITDLMADMADAGWTQTDSRVRDGQAVVEWVRGTRRLWALVDVNTNDVIGGNALRGYRLETVSEYLARTAHLVHPDPKHGTDWQGR